MLSGRFICAPSRRQRIRRTLQARWLIALLALAAILPATPAQASATAWYNHCSSQTYATVQVYNNGWYNVRVNPCYRAGSAYVTAEYYQLTPGWCSIDYLLDGTYYGTHVGNSTGWVWIPRNMRTYFYRC